MREKLAIAKKLRISRKNFSNKKEHQKLCSKCYRTYIVECIIKRKDNFQIIFEGKYIEKLPKRLFDWFKYVLDNIYRFYLVHITPNDDTNFIKYEFIHYGVSKPIHLKVSSTPNEYILETFLLKNGLKIIDEHLYATSTIYDITKI